MRRFLRDEIGAATVEGVLWLGFYLFFLFAIIDMTLVFHAKARVLEMAQDGLRGLAVGQIATFSDTDAWIEQAIVNITPNATSITTEVDQGLFVATVRVPSRDVNGFGIFSALRGFEYEVVAQHVVEVSQ